MHPYVSFISFLFPYATSVSQKVETQKKVGLRLTK